MITRLPTHVGDTTCSAAVVARGLVFLSHHAGGLESPDPAEQARAVLTSLGQTLATAGSSLGEVLQVNLYLRSIADLRAVCDVFPEFFGDAAPARMTTTTEFFDDRCLVMIDGVALAP